MTSINRVITSFDDDDIYPVFKFGQKQGQVLPLRAPNNMDENIDGFQAVIDEYRVTNKAGTPGVQKDISTVINKGIQIS